MNRQEMEYYTRKYGVLLIVGLAMLLFLLPLLMRLVQGAPITPGAQSYEYLRQADLVWSGSISYDPLAQAALAPNPYVLLLALMQTFGVPWLLPILLAILFAIMLYYYLARVLASRALIMLVVMIVLLSPSMSILATHHTTTLLGMIFVLSSLLWFQRFPLLGCIAVGLAMITAPVMGLLAAILFAFIFFRRNQFHEVIGIVLAIAVVVAWFILWTGAGPNVRELLTPSFNPHIFFEFGNTAGISLFLVVLALYGMVVQLGKNNDVVLYSALLFVAALFLPSLTPVAVVALAIFAAKGIYHLLTVPWELELLQSSLLMLIACIGLFLFITTARDRVTENPDAEFAHLMTTLRNQYREGAVLSAPEYAPMIEYFTGRKATVDERTRDIVLENVFYSRQTSTLYPYLSETQTSYVLITSDMQRSMFQRSDQGLLFLLQNTQHFVKIADSEGNTLWYFIRTT